MGIHRRYYGQASEPGEEAKPDSAAPDDKAQHMLDALNKDAANALCNERLRESDKKQSTG